MSEDSSEREDAVHALGESRRPEAVEPLSLALQDEDEDVREAAVAALANIGGDEAAKALMGGCSCRNCKTSFAVTVQPPRHEGTKKGYEF